MTSKNETYAFILASLAKTQQSQLNNDYLDWAQDHDGSVLLRLGDQVFSVTVTEVTPAAANADLEQASKGLLQELPYPRKH